MPRLLVDAGNVLFNHAERDSKDSIETITAKGISEIYGAMNYHAVAVGPFDLAAGLDFIRESGETGIPWVSANIYDEKGKRPFKPYITVNTGDLAIGVVGLTDSETTVNKNIEVRDAIVELGTLIPEIAVNHDMIIVLSNLSHDRSIEISKRFAEVKVVVGADRRKGNITPLLSNDAVIMQTDSLGKYLGVLSVSWFHAPWKVDQTNKLAQLKNHLKSADRQLDQLSTEKDKTSQGYKNKALILERNKEKILTEISAIETAQKAETLGLTPSTFDADMIALERSLPQDRKISAIVGSIKDQINSYKIGQAAASNRQ